MNIVEELNPSEDEVLQVERRLISAILSSDEDRIIAFQLESLQPEEFSNRRHQLIVSAIRSLFFAPQKVSPSTIAEMVRSICDDRTRENLEDYLEALLAERFEVNRQDFLDLRYQRGLRSLL